MKVLQDKLKPLVSLSVFALCALPLLIALPQHAAPRNTGRLLELRIDPVQSAIHWTLGSSLHTIHGTFALKSGRLQVDPATGKVSGEIVADATSGQSGNDGRDRKMHTEVLESGQFGEIIFRPDHLAGRLETQGESSVQVHGVFVLHGSEHDLTVPVHASIAGDHWSGRAKFSVPYIEWGLKNPSTWLLKADHSVAIELELKGAVQTQAAQ